MTELTQRQTAILEVVEGYSYNAYEVCRTLNGFDPDAFRPCFQNRRLTSDRCNRKTRQCLIGSRSVGRTLTTLVKKGVLHSIKLRWFDKGRAKNGLCTDHFRFYFTKKEDLALRLIHDINKHLLEN